MIIYVSISYICIIYIYIQYNLNRPVNPIIRTLLHFGQLKLFTSTIGENFFYARKKFNSGGFPLLTLGLSMAKHSCKKCSEKLYYGQELYRAGVMKIWILRHKLQSDSIHNGIKSIQNIIGAMNIRYEEDIIVWATGAN